MSAEHKNQFSLRDTLSQLNEGRDVVLPPADDLLDSVYKEVDSLLTLPQEHRLPPRDLEDYSLGIETLRSTADQYRFVEQAKQETQQLMAQRASIWSQRTQIQNPVLTLPSREDKERLAELATQEETINSRLEELVSELTNRFDVSVDPDTGVNVEELSTATQDELLGLLGQNLGWLTLLSQKARNPLATTPEKPNVSITIERLAGAVTLDDATRELVQHPIDTSQIIAPGISVSSTGITMQRQEITDIPRPSAFERWAPFFGVEVPSRKDDSAAYNRYENQVRKYQAVAQAIGDFYYEEGKPRPSRIELISHITAFTLEHALHYTKNATFDLSLRGEKTLFEPIRLQRIIAAVARVVELKACEDEKRNAAPFVHHAEYADLAKQLLTITDASFLGKEMGSILVVENGKARLADDISDSLQQP
ncbi:hypothetical protein HY468_03380 [Candidatus Roizmanbacteria bacterium]|nr:hypothetical protein [Candidatus Roizmanbacteria bacterium]